MSDFARLEEKLAKLRHRGPAPGEARKLRGSDAQALLRSLVTEIDETVLPRRLSLSTGKVEIHLAVANRRLQALVSPPPDVEGASDLADKALPDAEDPGVPALLQVLTQVFGEARSVEVSATRLSAPFSSDVGVPANMLARAWNVSEQVSKPLEPGEIMSKFLKGISKDAFAWLRIEGEAVTDQAGSDDRVAALGEQAAIFLDGYFAKFDALFPEDAPACGTVIATGSDKEASLFFVEIGEVSAFIAAKPAKVGALAGLWQGLVTD